MRTLAIIGTRAQAIKMAPVVRAIRDAGLPCEIVLTGQHYATVDSLLADFGLEADARLWDKGEITRVPSAGIWAPVVLARLRRFIKARTRNSPVTTIVHGDTMTTLLGAAAGYLAGSTVAHVEAGLRSGCLWDPFPEELIRRSVTRLAQIAYCPGEAATEVVQGQGREAVDTHENTVLDALKIVLGDSWPPSPGIEPPQYVLISAHRLETVMRRSRLTSLVELTLRISETFPVRFVLHPITRRRLRMTGLIERLEQCPDVELLERMRYPCFIRLASGARAVLTDGGGNQEEMAYLGVPTFLLRRRTERSQGLDDETHLVGLDIARTLKLLGEIGPDRQSTPLMETESPARVIAMNLYERSIGT